MATNATATRDTRALTVRDQAKQLQNVISLCDKDLLSLLDGDEKRLKRMKEVFILSCKQTPKLLECSQASLVKAVFTCASLNLEPDPYMGQVYLIPYGENVQVIPGYKGLQRLVRNTKEINSISCEAVHQNDKYEYMLGSDPYVHHWPAIENRGEILFFYCVVSFKDGGKHITVMNKEEVDRVRDGSSGYQAALKFKKSTPWKEHYEEMGKKTVFRRAVKMLPVSITPQLSNAISVDNANCEGKIAYVHKDEVEVIDIWAEETSTEEKTTSSRLDAFADSQDEGQGTLPINPDAIKELDKAVKK